MKTDWKAGDVFCYCINKDSEDRGTLADKTPLGGKYVVESVWRGLSTGDSVAADGLIFYFDEIKPVIQIKGEL